MTNPSRREDEWYSKVGVVVVPLCLVGLLASLADDNDPNSREAWWGLLFVAGLVGYFVVLPYVMHCNRKR